MKTKLAFVLFLLSGLLLEVKTHAADHSTVLPYVVDDVAAIAYLDLQKVDLSALVDEVRDLGALPQDQADGAATGTVMFQGWLNGLVGLGATRAYVLFRASDLQHLGPTWVLPLADDADANAVIQSLKQFGGPNRLVFPATEFQVVNSTVLAAMDKTQMERLATHRTGKQRKEVVAALAELGNGDAGLVVFGDADSRRVLREMFPRLPVPFQQIDGRLIADDLRWGGAVIDLPPGPKVAIHIETSGPQVAEALQQSAVQGLELAKPLLLGMLSDISPGSPTDGILQALGLLKPKVEGQAMKLTLGDDAEELARVRDLLSAPIAAAQAGAQRNQRMNLFKQLALAFLNYESANGAFVGQANYDETGKPLLSWRVHLLPFLDQKALYDEFHLDEPWDSLHNRQLIARMPDSYADPSGSVRRVVGAGRTTFVSPVSEGTLFPPREALPEGQPLKIRDVKDGTSKTILFVEVVPERAVVWTKPEDWEVDVNHPLQGVKRAERSDFLAAYCDGHVRYIPNDIDAKKFLALLTRAGGERVD